MQLYKFDICLYDIYIYIYIYIHIRALQLLHVRRHPGCSSPARTSNVYCVLVINGNYK